MTTTTSDYVFNSRWEGERGRLNLLEEAYDPATLAQLSRLGVEPGWTCLEVGAGAGSIARWLGRQVGPTGRVFAADLDISHLTSFEGSNVEVVQSDLRHDPLPAENLDFVHARLVLGHIPEREQILAALVASLKPGGSLLIEETESFTADGPGLELHAQVIRAGIEAMERAGFEMGFGGRLPALLSHHGLVDVAAEGAIPLRPGGSAELTWLLMTFDQMLERGLTFNLPPGAYESWRRMTTQPDRWLTGLAVVRAWGRKPF
jgi:SAM-dependent methyltransferase